MQKELEADERKGKCGQSTSEDPQPGGRISDRCYVTFLKNKFLEQLNQKQFFRAALTTQWLRLVLDNHVVVHDTGCDFETDLPLTLSGYGGIKSTSDV
jgi:hypothetical protein